MNKINLSLLKECVEALELSLSAAKDLENVRTEQEKNALIIELSKAAGVAAGIMQEASLLVMDIQAIARSLQVSAPSDSDKILNQVLPTSSKGTGNSGNMN